MNSETISISTHRFDEMGIPTELTEYVASQVYPKKYRKLFWVAMGLTIMVMMSAIALLLWGNFALLEHLQQARVERLERPYQYHQETGIAPTLLFFVCIMALGATVSIVARAMKKQLSEYMIFATLETGAKTSGLNGALTRAWYRRVYRHLAGLRVEDQLVRIHELTLAMYRRPLLIMVYFTIPFIVFDVNNYEVADRQGATFGPYLSLDRRLHRWNEAVVVQVGCWVFEQDDPKLYYDVYWSEGDSYNLLEGRPEGMALELAEFVHRRLLEGGAKREFAKFTYGIHTGDLKLDPTCVPLLGKRHKPEDLNRLRGMLGWETW